MTLSFTNHTDRLLTRGLFYETAPEPKQYAIYTLGGRDRTIRNKTFPSLYRLYMECSDPTEYEFSSKHLAGWQHWQMISNSLWFQEIRDQWRVELEVKVRSAAIRAIASEAVTEGRNSFQANKYLADAGWQPKGSAKSPVGRPTQERIKQEAERIMNLEQDILDDHRRIN